MSSGFDQWRLESWITICIQGYFQQRFVLKLKPDTNILMLNVSICGFRAGPVMSWCLVIYNLLSGHQDVDGRSCSLHPCLVTAATLRCSQPDGSWDKYVNITPPYQTSAGLNVKFQVSIHQHHLVLLPLAGHVQQFLQPLHLRPVQCE